MLTLEENRWNCKAIKIYSALNIFPIEINEVTGKIQRQSNKIRVFIWKVFFVLAIIHWIRMMAKLVQSVIHPDLYFSWGHFVVHYLCNSGYFAFFLAAYSLFLKNGEENVMIFNQLFIMHPDPFQEMEETTRTTIDQNENATDSKNRKENEENSPVPIPVRPLLSWPLEYTLHDLVARTIPLMMAQCGVFFLIVIAMDPTRPQLLYSSLPQEYQNWMTYFLLLSVDVYSMTLCISNATFSIAVQLQFFSKCQLEFEQMNRQLKKLKEQLQIGFRIRRLRNLDREMWILQQILNRMEKLVLFIELFNRTFPFCIFAFKVHCLFVSILGYFFVIRHCGELPLFAGFCGYVASVCTTTYMILYQHAFSIPEKMNELKHEFLLRAQASACTKESQTKQNQNQNHQQKHQHQNQNKKNPWPEMKRRIKKIRKVGIQVGGFHTMERESSPNFLDFVTQNVVSLLCTVPR